MRARPHWLSQQAQQAEPARAVSGVPDDVRALVLARAGHRCESCGWYLLGRPYSVHHRRPRGMGGTRDQVAHSPINLLVLCGRDNATGCHGLVHRNPDSAYDVGLLVRRGADPARVAITLPDGRRVLLGADGTYIPEGA
ncbi:HNH endonuclease [Protofrankia coriariae]|uniref:HNH nuclease domain-containing protein n=1 Tax=Protofrankia coriariae TaxID=1562887 RepID=A0ABR5F4C5_9ACTN|nr:HNH endonuclease signature motif containing protein [Protofrankia coriariae]KLL11558.1 hypothetical protein FrCorBMG51_10990 [Protofrankia coriariae]